MLLAIDVIYGRSLMHSILEHQPLYIEMFDGVEKLSEIRISNHMLSDAWGEIAYQFPKGEGISNFLTHFIMDVTGYPCWF